MAHKKLLIIFNNMAEFDAWNATASAKAGGNYAFPYPRITPPDGSVAATFMTTSGVWDGPTKTAEEARALGYLPPLPPPPE